LWAVFAAPVCVGSNIGYCNSYINRTLIV